MSTLVAQTISNGSVSTSSANVIQGSAKAWVCFNGTNGSIKASYNVSSVTRNTTGDYTLNFTNALIDANYALATCGVIPNDAGGASAFFLYGPSGWGNQPTLKTTTQARMLNRREANLDIGDASVSIFR
jgi:hypothetical protein